MSSSALGKAVRSVAIVAALAGCSDDLEYGEHVSAIDLNLYQLPSLSEGERMEIVRRYDHLDPTNLVPRGLLEDAILYFDVNNAVIPKTDYFVVIDFSLFSGMDRFWLVDVDTGVVEPHKTAHGDGTDPDHDGYADSFGNVSGSHKSSLGFYLTGEIYDGTHLHSMRLDGLSRDGSPNGMANTNARSRLIVMHEASYVNDDSTAKQGRSNGCPALDPDVQNHMADRIHGGSLMYAATSALNTPVGRASCGDSVCDGTETAGSCASDCDTDPADDPQDPGEDPGDDAGDSAGCAAGGPGAGLGVVLALAGIRRRRRC